jgi:hypothetical protein
MKKGEEEEKLVVGVRNRYTLGLVGVAMSTGRNCGFGWKGKQIFGCVGARKGAERRTKCWTARDLLS